MTVINKTLQLWDEMRLEKANGLLKKLYSADFELKIYCIYRYPENYCGVGFSFDNQIKVSVESFKKLSEFRVKIYDDNSFTNSYFLAVELLDDSKRRVFSTLCEDLVNQACLQSNEAKMVHCVINLLERWKNLFSKIRSQSQLSTEMQQGLFGELCFLSDLIKEERISNEDAIRSWEGTDMAVRDFRGPDWAVEIKTTTCNSPDKLTINGVNQLDDLSVKTMYLTYYALEVGKNAGITLADKVKEIRLCLDDDAPARNAFDRKLLDAGYLDSDEELYTEYKYIVRSDECYTVKDDFPRIVQSELRLGVSVPSYQIDLALCRKYAVAKADLLQCILS